MSPPTVGGRRHDRGATDGRTKKVIVDTSHSRTNKYKERSDQAKNRKWYISNMNFDNIVFAVMNDVT